MAVLRFLFLLCILPAACLAQAQTAVPDPRHQKNIDSIRQLYHEAKTDIDRLNSLMLITDAYYDRFDFKNTLLYNEYILLLSDKLKRSTDSAALMAGRKGEAAHYHNRGQVSYKQGEYRQALNSYLRAFSLFDDIKNLPKSAEILSDIASTYSGMGDYSESLNYSFKALKNQEALGNKQSIAVELNNIGAIYQDLKNNSRAIEYFSKALDISQKLGDKKHEALYMGNIGHNYQIRCDSAFAAGDSVGSLPLQEKALMYYFKALGISEENSDKDNTAVCFENIGIVYSNETDFKKALPYLLKALDIYKELGLKAEQSYCFNMLGDAYLGMKENKKAEDCFHQAMALAGQTHSNYYLMEANMASSNFYEKTKRPTEALMYYKNYIANRDSIYNQENTNKLVRSEMNYEFEKKQAITKFENDKVIYRLEAENKIQKQLRAFLIVVLVLVIVLLFLSRRAYDNKKRMAEFMSAESERKEVLLQEVHHRINNNLQIISSLLSLQANSAEDSRLHEYLTQSQNRIQSLAVLHDLLYHADSPLQINMKTYLDKVMDYHRDVLSNLPVKAEIELDIADVNFPTKVAVPIALVLNELVTNSTKYAFKDGSEGRIMIALSRLEDKTKWLLRVSDTGKGIPENVPARKDSLGLRLIGIMAKQLNASLTKSNTPGATFEIVFTIAA